MLELNYPILVLEKALSLSPAFSMLDAFPFSLLYLAPLHKVSILKQGLSPSQRKAPILNVVLVSPNTR